MIINEWTDIAVKIRRKQHLMDTLRTTALMVAMVACYVAVATMEVM